MEKTIRLIFYFGPVLFGFGFLAPLIAQTMLQMSFEAPLGLTPLQTGLIIGGTLGIITQLRGRWI